jgi:hypothetical protein
VQVLLEALRRRQPLQQPHLEIGRVVGIRAGRFELGLEPALLVHVRDVHELRADVLGVGFLQRVDDLAQRPLGRPVQGSRVEGQVKIGFGQAVELRVEIGNHRHAAQVDGIDLGAVMAQQAVGLDEPEHGRLLARVVRAGGGCDGRRCAPAPQALLQQPADLLLARPLQGGRVMAVQGFEVLPPLRIDGARIREEALIEFLHELRVAGIDERRVGTKHGASDRSGTPRADSP